MACTFISRFRIKPDSHADFIRLVALMEANSTQESATLAYKFYRLAEPDMFAVFESFTSEAGDEAHQKNPHNLALIDDMVACMDGAYTREYLYDLT